MSSLASVGVPLLFVVRTVLCENPLPPWRPLCEDWTLALPEEPAAAPAETFLPAEESLDVLRECPLPPETVMVVVVTPFVGSGCDAKTSNELPPVEERPSESDWKSTTPVRPPG